MIHSSTPTIRLPYGVRDFLPKAAERRRRIVGQLMDRFQSWGYQQIITPLFECAEVLALGMGDDAKSAAIRFIEPSSGEVVALRPDITPQIARIAATRMGEVNGPIRFCYEGAVARIGAGAKGQREILQAGVELLGAEGVEADAELIALAAKVLEEASEGGGRRRRKGLELGHVALLNFAMAEISDSEKRRDISGFLRNKDRVGVKNLARSLPVDIRTLLETLPSLYGDPQETLARAQRLKLPKHVRAALNDLEGSIELASLLVAKDCLEDLQVDLGELQGFDYYTGMRLSAYVEGAGGAVLRGGRYDKLVAQYGGQACATGFAVDVEALAQAESQSRGTNEVQRICVLIEPGRNEDEAQLVRELCSTLRSEGISCAVDLPQAKGDSDNQSYAESAGFSHRLQWHGKGCRLQGVRGGERIEVGQKVYSSLARQILTALRS